MSEEILFLQGNSLSQDGLDVKRLPNLVSVLHTRHRHLSVRLSAGQSESLATIVLYYILTRDSGRDSHLQSHSGLAIYYQEQGYSCSCPALQQSEGALGSPEGLKGIWLCCKGRRCWRFLLDPLCSMLINLDKCT